MKKVIVIGSGGAGKSTFARRLGATTGIEVFHLDKLYWKANWTKTPKDEWAKIVENLIRKDEWIMDGNFGGTMEIRLAACDTAIFLDLPRYICFYRVFKRWKMYWKTNRPDMTEGCNEKIDLNFVQWIWSFPKTKKPEIEETLKRFESEKMIIRLKSNRGVEDFLMKVSRTSVLNNSERRFFMGQLVIEVPQNFNMKISVKNAEVVDEILELIKKPKKKEKLSGISAIILPRRNSLKEDGNAVLGIWANNEEEADEIAHKIREANRKTT